MKVLETDYVTEQIEIAEHKRTQAGYLIGKRCFDLIASLIASMILIIPMAAVALIIILKDPGNPFYIQERVGKNGKMIKVAKFRSMYKNADKLNQYLTPEELERYKKEYKLEDDPRILGHIKGSRKPCFGKILRQTSIDELPQIPYNICIMGNMSLVGPRPVLQEELERNYTKEQQQLFLSAKPGLTGYWQAYARNNATYTGGQRQKMELFYIRNANFRMDLKIILATVGAVLRKTGAE